MNEEESVGVGYFPSLVEKRKRCSTITLRILGVATLILGIILAIQLAVAFMGLGSKRIERFLEYVPEGPFAEAVTSCGLVKGLVQNGSFAFLGIQYAVPPVKNRRWQIAETHASLDECWNGTFDAVEHHKPCWQFYPNGSYDGVEDCLYLDVYTPKLHTDSPLPVVVFVGGETLDGGESFEVQPSAKLAKEKGCVFVSVALRRSGLGYLSLNLISKGSPQRTSGNYAISDLQAALRWVQYNIRNFGGDRKRITVLGYQSGSTVSAAILNYGLHKDLFHQLWLSGGTIPQNLPELQVADKQNQPFLKLTGCKTLKCMLEIPPEELLENVPYKWRTFYHELPDKNEIEHQWMVFDGTILKRSRSKDAPSNHIPLVAGAPMHIDASLEMRQALDWNNTGSFREMLDNQFGPEFAFEIFRLYRRPDTNHWQQFAQLLSDVTTICPLLRFTTEYYNSNPDKVYFYLANHIYRTSIGYLAPIGMDIRAIFNLFKPRSYKDTQYAENMSAMFYKFVMTGTPINPNSSPNSIILVNDRISGMNDHFNCELWNNYHKRRMKVETSTEDEYWSHEDKNNV